MGELGALPVAAVRGLDILEASPSGAENKEASPSGTLKTFGADCLRVS